MLIRSARLRDNGERAREAPPSEEAVEIAGFDDDGAHITDVWESQEHFERWMQSRLGAAIEQAGVEGQPDVRFVPLAGVYAPAFGQEGQTETI